MSGDSLGEPIERTGNLYAWGDDQILKLYDKGIPDSWIQQMHRMDQSLHATGLPVPAVGELIEINGCQGQIYERIEGGTMLDDLLSITEATPKAIAKIGQNFAEIHAQIHSKVAVPEIPSQRQLFPDVIRAQSALPPDLKEATLKAFDNLPVDNRLCHGDFHPLNVMISPVGPIVIDWNNTHIGNPLEDVARSFLILDGASISEGISDSLLEPFKNAYLDRYFQLRPADQQQFIAWRPIVAAIRLADNIPQLEAWLLDQIKIELAV